jgi:hypothetical protein
VTKNSKRTTKLSDRAASGVKVPSRGQRTKVNITVKHGTVRDVEFIPKIPRADVTIYDYDVDGLEERRISKDSRGKPCLITKLRGRQ